MAALDRAASLRQGRAMSIIHSGQRAVGRALGLGLLALSSLSAPVAVGAARWARERLPWRVSDAGASFMARGEFSRSSWALAGALAGLPWGWGLACAGAMVGAICRARFARAMSNPQAQERAGRAWLAWVSSSQLAGTLGARGGVAASAWAGPRPAGLAHPGWRELASRVARPEAGEGQDSLQARARLRAMALAMSGSEPAARWLWRRRQSQRSMRDWALALAKASPTGSSRWEAACAMADLMALGACAGARAWELEKPALELLGAKELSEGCIPLLWAGFSGGRFGSQIESALNGALSGQPMERGWGWSSVEGQELCARRLAQAWARLRPRP